MSISVGPAYAGLDIVRSSGISLTGADGINYIGTSGISLTGADGILAYRANGISLTGADGISLTGADGISLTGADGSTYVGPNGISLTGADGISLTGADGMLLVGANGISLTGADGTQYRVDSLLIRRPAGISLTGADGISLTGADGISLTGADGAARRVADGISLTGADGISLTGADGISLTGADGISLTGADQITGFDSSGIVVDKISPAGISLTGADGISLTGADGISLTGADGILFRNISGIAVTGADSVTGLQGLDPDLALWLNNATDDSSVNAVLVFHDLLTEGDLNMLRANGIIGGTRFKVLPMVYITATKQQLIAISHSPRVRSIYGNRTLTFNSDPYYKSTGITRVASDRDLTYKNSGFPVSGRNVTVAVLDTGINSLHSDLSGKVVQNVRLADVQSIPLAGFINPLNVENVPNTDLLAGHGTFVSGIIAGSGSSSGGKYAGVAPGARLVGLSAGDVDLTHVLSGFDYLLDKGSAYNVRVLNCSFSANTVYDENDPVNVASKMLTDNGVSVVFSAGNAGPGNGTLNPYAQAPWVVSVGATDQNGVLAPFSSRGDFGQSSPTLSAPGVNVASLRGLPTTTSIGGLVGADLQRLSLGELPFYTTASGTSFSAPQVAGAIALMLETNPSLQPAAIKDILARTATPLPKYFAHEVGGGTLNTYAAVLEAAFPQREIGMYRAALASSPVRFATSTPQMFTEPVTPGVTRAVSVAVPENVLQAGVNISWGLSANDFGLKLYDSRNALLGESNYLNVPGLTGRFEEVVVRNPAPQTLRAMVQNSTGIGTQQNVYGAIQITQAVYPTLSDLNSLSPAMAAQVQKSLLSNIVLAQGKRFMPYSPMSRYDLAATFVRAGLVPQYLAGSPMFTDTKDLTTRNAVEGVQSNPAGKLFYDASPGGNFYPNNSATRLTAAIAFVKAAGLENEVNTTILLSSISDVNTVPYQYRGYLAVALNHGFLSLDNGQLNVYRSLTRVEAVVAFNRILNN
ncbi:MAG TPA: S8 family serine peptidase [Pyrinomonadaceae bacterium]|nr:S8 family serine peptidase [Pyrinomonadaceae bacterium]